MPQLIAIQERFDALAAEALEDLIDEVEARDPVRAVALEVKLVPDEGRESDTPTVTVHLTVERETSSTTDEQRPGRPGKGLTGWPPIH